MNKHLNIALVALLTFVITGVSFAEEEAMNMQTFTPSIFGGDFIAIEDADALGSLGFGFGILYDYAKSPYSYFQLNKDKRVPDFDIIDYIHTGHFSLAFGPAKWIAIGGYLPIHYVQYRTYTNTNPITERGDLEGSGVVLGDAMAKIKFQALFQDQHKVVMAIIPYATFPTGTDEEYHVTEDRVTIGGKLVLAHDFGPIDLAVNGGYLSRLRPNRTLDTLVGDAITYGIGLSHTWDVGVGLGLEYWGRYYFVDTTENLNNYPMELTASIRYQFGKRGPRLIAGAGPGLSYGSGAPSYRVIAGLDYYYLRPDTGKLVINTVDQNGESITATLHILGPENDERKGSSTGGSYSSTGKTGEYVITAKKEGYNQAEGQAVVSRGKDSVIKLVLNEIPKPKTILALTVIETHSGNKIPASVEIGGQAYAAGDGTLSRELAPGTYTVKATAAGHAPGTTSVTMVSEKTTSATIKLNLVIDLIGEVYFATASDVILKKSHPVLDDVVAKINKLGHFHKLTIQGHTDSQGPDEYNMKLSDKRAKAVKNYLIHKGIDGSKLFTFAFGETKPVASNETKDGRAQNRRVEFIVE